MNRTLYLVFIFIFITPIFAQGAFTEYRWQNENLSLNYPASWEEPVQRFSAEGDRAILLLAQIQAGSPEIRPPAIPFLTVTVLREASFEDDLYTLLETELEAINIEAVGALPSALFERQAIGTFGISRDGQYFGLGRIIYLDAQRGAIMIYGRTASVQSADFNALFNALANSLTLDASQSALAPEYGVLWQTSRSFADGERAFLDVAALALSGDTLYLADAVVGLVTLDRLTGIVQSITAFDDIAEPTDIAIAPDGSVYVADSLCTCIHIFSDNSEIDTITGFAEGSPQTIAIDPTNTLYVSNTISDEYVIDVIGTDFNRTLLIPQSAFEAPLLTIDRLGRLLVLVDGQAVYALENNELVLQYELSSVLAASAIAVDFQNNLLVATDNEGIVIFDSSGDELNQLGQVVSTEPQAGEVFQPQGLAAALDGTIYWADSDGSFGNVTAMSLSVEQGRIGSVNLISGVEAQGLLEGTIESQYWTFDASAGDIVTITALADESSFDFDIAMTLLDPRGEEIIFVDNDEENVLSNPFDAQIDNLRLQQEGKYIIIVEQVAGQGRYRLGLSKSLLVEIGETKIELNGVLNELFPVQRWQFQGRAAQTFNITVSTSDGTLDPFLSIRNAQGNIIAENDDAEDITLGFDAQLLDFRLPINGLYTIEAIRFDGNGNYLLTIENN